MKINELLKDVEIISVKGDLNQEIDEVVYDSRFVKPNSMFVCIKGFKVDGHQFANVAIEKGATCLIVQDEVQCGENITVIKVEDTRIALAKIADNLFDHPSSKFNLIGVTGTKGKTTTTFMIKSILEKARQKVGLIGTIANYVGDKEFSTSRTTPESFEIQRLFSQMAENDADSVVMEVSSQGLKLNRVKYCNFNIGVFTNLSKDHIGPNEHPHMEDYLNSKIKLFSMCQKGLVNIDSKFASKVISEAKCDMLTYGIEENADIKATNVVTHSNSVEFHVVSPWGETDIKLNIPGKFSIYNALGAIGVCGMSGISLELIKDGLLNVKVPGRAEIVETDTNFTVMIDYAHSPDSLENILSTVKAYAPGRLVCLFGCGGDRDNTKRPIMGKIAGQYCDYSIITSDNPRTEDPNKILCQIEEGIKETNCKYTVIENRREAIKYALANAQEKDIIVLAGKGHETYQEFANGKVDFDEKVIVKELLKDM